MSKTCSDCHQVFIVSESDIQFYDKISPSFQSQIYPIPQPSNCPDCRAQQRMALRNEKTLYQRKCSLCQKEMISIYQIDTAFPVYCQECFWGDAWDATEYGQELDFQRPFFIQFQALLNRTPRLGIVNKQAQNSDYCNYSFANKNCYLTFGNHYEEDCMYGRYSTKNKNCVDYMLMYQSELCYESLFSKNCYRSVFIEHCEDCQECCFSSDLKNCKHCLFSSNLRHKEYYIFNKPYSKEDYFQELKKYNLGSYSSFMRAKEHLFNAVRLQSPVRALYQIQCENCEGDNLEHCKNAYQCFDCSACEDIAYAAQIDNTNSSMDMTCMGYDKSELCYQTIGCSGLFNALFCDSCWHNNDLFYSQLCFSSKNCFGCIAVKHQEYCILNRQYQKEEYEVLLPKLIAHMSSTGEWGNFFPSSISPFAYNETLAQEYFPLVKAEAMQQGWKWKESEAKDYHNQVAVIPDDIQDYNNDSLKEVLACTECKKNYQLTTQEVGFYRNLQIPIPRACPDCRVKSRMARKNPRSLWDRQCMNCHKNTRSTYVSVRKEKIYCQECFENMVN